MHSPAGGYTVSGQPEGNRAARSSVRPVATVGRPEHVEATAPLPCSGSYAAVVVDQPGRSARACRWLKIAKRASRSAGDYLVGEGIRDAALFLYVTSWTIMGSRWGGMPRLGRVPAGAPRAEAANASAWLGTVRDQSQRPRRPVSGVTSSCSRTGMSSSRRDQLRTAERRPAGEGLEHPYQRTAQREKGLSLQPVGLDRGRRATSTPPDPVRAACRELTSNPHRQRSPLGDLRESESSLRSDPGSREAPPGFYGGKPWKSLKTIQSSHTPGPLHSPLQHPTGKLLTGMEPALSENLPAPELHP